MGALTKEPVVPVICHYWGRGDKIRLTYTSQHGTVLWYLSVEHNILLPMVMSMYNKQKLGWHPCNLCLAIYAASLVPRPLSALLTCRKAAASLVPRPLSALLTCRKAAETKVESGDEAAILYSEHLQ